MISVVTNTITPPAIVDDLILVHRMRECYSPYQNTNGPWFIAMFSKCRMENYRKKYDFDPSIKNKEDCCN